MPNNSGDAIPRSEPFVVSAQSEKTFNSVWLRNINISVPDTSQSNKNRGHIHIECLPYDAEGKEIYKTADNAGAESISIPNRKNGKKSFWQCVDEVPEVKDAMDAIVAAIPALRAWANTPPESPEPPEVPEVP
jgi:hypothetical protein